MINRSPRKREIEGEIRKPNSIKQPPRTEGHQTSD